MRLSDLTCLAQQPGTGGIVAPVRAYLLTHSNARRSLAQPGGSNGPGGTPRSVSLPNSLRRSITSWPGRRTMLSCLDKFAQRSRF